MIAPSQQNDGEQVERIMRPSDVRSCVGIAAAASASIGFSSGRPWACRAAAGALPKPLSRLCQANTAARRIASTEKHFAFDFARKVDQPLIDVLEEAAEALDLRRQVRHPVGDRRNSGRSSMIGRNGALGVVVGTRRSATWFAGGLPEAAARASATPAAGPVRWLCGAEKLVESVTCPSSCSVTGTAVEPWLSLGRRYLRCANVRILRQTMEVVEVRAGERSQQKDSLSMSEKTKGEKRFEIEEDLSKVEIPEVVAVLPLRGIVIFPSQIHPFLVSRAVLAQAARGGRRAQRIIGAGGAEEPRRGESRNPKGSTRAAPRCESSRCSLSGPERAGAGAGTGANRAG